MSIRKSRSKTLLLGALLAGLTSPRAALAVNNGAIDTGDNFPWVVRLESNEGGACSGTLVTPVWVLTARHCFVATSSGTNVDSTITVKFGIDVLAGAEDFSRMHTKTQSGPVLLRSATENNFLDDDEISRDVALVRLDTPVEPFRVLPLHPSLVADSCGSDFTGELVGYGGAFETCADPPGKFRRHHSSGGWVRDTADFGDVFANDWWTFLEPSSTCAEYFGSGGGDSGGALLRNGALCGVISGHYTVIYPALFDIWNSHAAVDSQETIAWLAANIIDSLGNFEGECGTATAQNDPDEDGIPNACDTCPNVFNPEQLQLDDDTDADGLGDACDFCTDLTVKDQSVAANCNFETERAVAFPGSAPPDVLRPSDFSSIAELDDMKEYILASFHPDACDPVPCPRHHLTETGGSLPGGELPAVPPLTCQPWEHCKWKIKNRITMNPMASPEIIAAKGPAGTMGTVGLRWCSCSGFDTKALDGRKACENTPAFQCVINANQYSVVGKWNKVYTEDSGSWVGPKEYGKEWLLSVSSPATQTSTYWDFLDLGAPFVQTSGLSSSVDGVLWSHIVGLSESIAGIFASTVPLFANSYGTGDAFSIYVATSGPPQAINFAEQWYCPQCPMGVSDVFVEVGNPDPFLVSLSGVTQLLSPSSSISVYDDEANGLLTIVRASEPIGRLWQASAGSWARGVVVDSQRQISGLLVHDAMDVLPEYVPYGSSSQPLMSTSATWAFSGSLGRLFVLDPSVSPIAAPSGWMHELSSGAWTSLRLDPADTLGTVLAATFRIDDHGVYFIEQVGDTLALRCWFPERSSAPGYAFTTLAALPSLWSGFSKYWVVQGAEGDLLLAGTGKSDPQETILARFSFDSAAKLVFNGRAWLAPRLLAPPALTRAGVAVSRPLNEPALLRLALSAFTMPLPTEGPVLY